jgi:hypothetical protein
MSFAPQLVETILSTLGRDDELRRAILRRRWQGLAEDGPRHESVRCHEAHHAGPGSGTRRRSTRVAKMEAP